MGGHAPYGKMLDGAGPVNRNGRPGRVIDNPDEIAAVALALELAKEGKGAAQIAAALSAQGFTNRRGHPFHHETIRRIVARAG